ncbi:MAG: sugar ABC transporter permease [Spirochaetaceae bacterium]|jgi:ABC-type sugar transport system permease subunit|nr:sugar ABC transporter permease [Spirochaetaceae bacterium]
MEKTNANISNRKMAVEGFLLYLPAIIIIAGIVIYPMIFAFQMSFTNFRPTIKTVKIIGLANYLDVLTDGGFWRAVYRSLVFTIGCLIPQIVLGLTMAHLLNHPMLKCKMLFRGLAITPWLIPTVAVAMIFRFLFNDIYGIVNYILIWLKCIDKPYAWMANEYGAMFILILANVWRGTPLMLTMFLAALQGISTDFYEAARVDGASPWTQFLKITLPLLMPVVMVSGILRFIWTFNFYDLPWVMTGGGPGESTQTTPLYAYTRAFSGYRFGEGSAITILLFIILIFFALVYFFIRQKQEKIYR